MGSGHILAPSLGHRVCVGSLAMESLSEGVSVVWILQVAGCLLFRSS